MTLHGSLRRRRARISATISAGIVVRGRTASCAARSGGQPSSRRRRRSCREMPLPRATTTSAGGYCMLRTRKVSTRNIRRAPGSALPARTRPTSSRDAVDKWGKWGTILHSRSLENFFSLSCTPPHDSTSKNFLSRARRRPHMNAPLLHCAVQQGASFMEIRPLRRHSEGGASLSVLHFLLHSRGPCSTPCSTPTRPGLLRGSWASPGEVGQVGQRAPLPGPEFSPRGSRKWSSGA